MKTEQTTLKIPTPRKSNAKILYGLEIEGVFNLDNFKLFADYTKRHKESYLLKKDIITSWCVRCDGSLRVFKNKFADRRTLEFINEKPLNREKLILSLKDFKKAFGKHELNESIYFNSSTGLHFHFSKKGLKFSEKTLYPTLLKVREYVLNRLKNSGIRERRFIIKHYARSYARLNQRGHDGGQFLNKNDRYTEFNFLSETQRLKGMEWRSPNAVYIRTWKDFFKLVNIYCDAIELYVKLIEQTQQDNFKIDVTTYETEKNETKKIIVEDKNETCTLSDYKFNKSHGCLICGQFFYNPNNKDYCRDCLFLLDNQHIVNNTIVNNTIGDCFDDSENENEQSEQYENEVLN